MDDAPHLPIVPQPLTDLIWKLDLGQVHLSLSDMIVIFVVAVGLLWWRWERKRG